MALQGAKSLAVLENQVNGERTGVGKQYETVSINFIAIKFKVSLTKCKVVFLTTTFIL